MPATRSPVRTVSPAVAPVAPAAPLVVPPGRMPLVRDGRPLKVWRYAGLYAEDLMLCAGRVRIAGVPQAFWAVWDRGTGVLRERTTWSPRTVALPPHGLRVRARGVRVDLALAPYGDAVDVVSPHGPSWIWTRKTLMRANGTVTLGGRSRTISGATVLVDDSAGYHARATDWEWSAGVGTSVDGRAVAWNLVDGVHDDPGASERTVWVDGVAHPAGPAVFGATLDTVSAGGDALAFTAEATRERHDHVGPLRSDYVQPFGAFAGTVPGVGALASGFGVMERHSARW